jgi:D-glycero-D-manno-heptose 1,7-bisphosphate phosphatase
MIRAVFLDRDGVINRKPPEGQYVTCWEDFHILPGVVEGMALLNRAGFCLIVVTNQRCIAKGLMTVADLEKMHQRMSDFLACAGAIVDGIYYCSHEMEPPCGCRKPAPGMLLDAARSRDIDLPASWMIGDSDIDVEAGRNAGCKTARLLAPDDRALETESCRAASSAADIVAPSLTDAVRQILRREGAAVGSFTAAPATQS